MPLTPGYIPGKHKHHSSSAADLEPAENGDFHDEPRSSALKMAGKQMTSSTSAPCLKGPAKDQMTGSKGLRASFESPASPDVSEEGTFFPNAPIGVE